MASAFAAVAIAGIAGGTAAGCTYLSQTTHETTHMSFNSQQNITTTEDASCSNVNIYSLEHSHFQFFNITCGKNACINNMHMSPHNTCVMAQGAKAHASSSFKSVVNEVVGGIGSMSGNLNINENVNMTQNISTNLSETCNNYNCVSIRGAAKTIHDLHAKGDCVLVNGSNSSNNMCQMKQQSSITASTSADLRATEKTRDFGDELGTMFKGLVPLVLALGAAGGILFVIYMIYKKESGSSGDDSEAQKSAETASMEALLANPSTEEESTTSTA
jgi:hypothetical protein